MSPFPPLPGHGPGGDETAQQEHFGNGYLFEEGDTFALIENAEDSAHITATGYVVGHYARWIGKGAVLLPSTASDAKVQISAFREDARGRLVLVVIRESGRSHGTGGSVFFSCLRFWGK